MIAIEPLRRTATVIGDGLYRGMTIDVPVPKRVSRRARWVTRLAAGSAIAAVGLWLSAVAAVAAWVPVAIVPIAFVGALAFVLAATRAERHTRSWLAYRPELIGEWPLEQARRLRSAAGRMVETFAATVAVIAVFVLYVAFLLPVLMR
jgi:hypothetical protein